MGSVNECQGHHVQATYTRETLAHMHPEAQVQVRQVCDSAPAVAKRSPLASSEGKGK